MSTKILAVMSLNGGFHVERGLALKRVCNYCLLLAGRAVKFRQT